MSSQRNYVGVLQAQCQHFTNDIAGSTMYMDPEPTVALNNTEAMLSGREEEEEARILAALSSAVAAQSPRIWQVG